MTDTLILYGHRGDLGSSLGHPAAGMGAASCNWIATAVSLAGSLASSLIGGNKARKARKAAERERANRANREQAWYDKQYNTDYLDTKAGQRVLQRAQDIQDNYIHKADGAAAVGGQSASTVAQAKEAANRTIGSAISDIGAQDTSRKQQVADAHITNQMRQSQEAESAANEQAQQSTAAAQQASNAMMTQVGSLLGGAKSRSTSTLGGSSSSGDNAQIHNMSGLESYAAGVQSGINNRLKAASGIF